MNIDGQSLERATELIETHILNHIEKSKIGLVKIQTNKIIVVQGVKHEIDIYVTIDLLVGTTLLYIFECKNFRTKTISKNDIIIFEEKINILGAQKGFFVAKKFGRDSINRSKQSNRIELLKVEDNKMFDREAFHQMKTSYLKDIQCKITVSPAHTMGDDFPAFPIKIGEKDFTTINELVSSKIVNRLSPDPAITTIKNSIDFWEFDLTYDKPIINHRQFDKVTLNVAVQYQSDDPELIYDFKVEGKGRYIKIRMKDLSGKKNMIMELTMIDPSNIQFHSIEPEK